MTSKIEIVVPEIRNGIEFYVSSNGMQAGVSQVGLGKLIGLAESSTRTILVDRKEKGFFDFYNAENPDVASGSSIVLTSRRQARIVTSEACAEIILLQADKGNQTARLSLQKFVEIGFSSWVKSVVGQGEAQQLTAIQATLEQVMGAIGALSAEFQEMKTETSGYRKVVVYREGLKEWMSLEEEAASESDDTALVTLGEYLETEKKTGFDKAKMAYFANKVSYHYNAMSLKAPAKKRVIRNDGYWSPPVNAYTAKDYPILEFAYKQTVMKF